MRERLILGRQSLGEAHFALSTSGSSLWGHFWGQACRHYRETPARAKQGTMLEARLIAEFPEKLHTSIGAWRTTTLRFILEKPKRRRKKRWTKLDRLGKYIYLSVFIFFRSTVLGALRSLSFLGPVWIIVEFSMLVIFIKALGRKGRLRLTSWRP